MSIFIFIGLLVNLVINDSLEETTGGVVLAVVNLIEVVQPLLYSAGSRVKLDAIDVGCRSSVYRFTGSVFPHSASIHVATVNVTTCVKTLKCGNIEIKLSRNLRCPLGYEVVLRNIVLSKN